MTLPLYRCWKSSETEIVAALDSSWKSQYREFEFTSLRQTVSTAEKPCDFPLKIAENPRNSACFALKPDSEKVSCWTQKASFADLLSGGLTGSPVSRLPSGECNAIRNRSFCECDLTSVSNDVHRKDLASA